jgi:hypothetical protein
MRAWIDCLLGFPIWLAMLAAQMVLAALAMGAALFLVWLLIGGGLGSLP